MWYFLLQVDPLSEEGWKQKPNLNAIRSLDSVIRVHSECGERTPADPRLGRIQGVRCPQASATSQAGDSGAG